MSRKQFVLQERPLYWVASRPQTAVRQRHLSRSFGSPLLYGSFSYTEETHEAKPGPSEDIAYRIVTLLPAQCIKFTFPDTYPGIWP